MTDHNKQYLLMLNRMPGVGPVTVQKLLQYWPDLVELFCSSTAELIAQGLSEKLARTLTTCNRKAVELDWRWEMAADCTLITWGDPTYPSLLREIAAPPPVLYARGKLDCLLSHKLAIVGTRQPSVTGRQIAKKFSSELTGHGFTVVAVWRAGLMGRRMKGRCR